MGKFFDWLNKGMMDAVHNMWTRRSIKQYFRDFMFSLALVPVGVIRFFLDPLYIALLMVCTGLYWAVLWYFHLTVGI